MPGPPVSDFEVGATDFPAGPSADTYGTDFGTGPLASPLVQHSIDSGNILVKP